MIFIFLLLLEMVNTLILHITFGTDVFSMGKKVLEFVLFVQVI